MPAPSPRRRPTAPSITGASRCAADACVPTRKCTPASRPMTRPSNWRRTSSKTARVQPSATYAENFAVDLVPATPKSSSPSCTMNFRRHPPQVPVSSGVQELLRLGLPVLGRQLLQPAVLQFLGQEGDKRRDDTWFHGPMVAADGKLVWTCLNYLPSVSCNPADSGAGEGQGLHQHRLRSPSEEVRAGCERYSLLG